MNNTLATITPHGWILALFIRDDGERLLLGDGYYEFKEEQRHFVANTYINDVVELQGTDGQLIAGQVRRSQAQAFDGFVCDPTISQEITEQKRRDFFLFFRKNHEYKVVYIFPNGEAIQRKGGYIVDAPEIREIIQRSPEYHVALAFEDVNYYTYAEDETGAEIYSYETEIAPASAADGGLVWDEKGMVSDGQSLNLNGINGDTFQQSYEGWNIIDVDFENITSGGVTKTLNADKTITLNGKINAGLNFTFGKNISFDTSSQYTLRVEVLRGSSTPYTNDGLPNHQWAIMVNMGLSSQGWQSYAIKCADNITTVTFTPAQSTGEPRFWFGYNASTSDETTGIFDDYTLRISVKKGTTISDYEPFVGGQASPNPDYPQTIQTVAGSQTITIAGTNYPLDLGTIELCELGAYQDRIFKDGSDWKIHKETGKIALSSITWLTPTRLKEPT